MKKILVTFNPEYEPEDGTSFDAVLSALEHFDIPANLAEVNEDAPSPKGDALLDALKICGGIIDWAIDHGGDKVSLESIKRMSAEAIARYEDTDGVAKQYEVFKGYLDFEGVVLNVEFQAPVGSTVAEKDAAFMAALAQQADVDYVSVKQEFLAMQAEIESIEMSVAKGEATEHSDARLRELYDLMEESPWELDPDEGIREKSANANRP